MNIQDRKGLKQSAAASLNGARSEKAIVTIYFAITTVLSVLVMVANLILDHFIAGTGGLSNLGSRTMLQTVQTVLPYLQALIVLCLDMGYLRCVMEISRDRDPAPDTLKDGFSVFWPTLRMNLLLGAIYLGFAVLTFYLAMQIFLFTPSATPLVDAITSLPASVLSGSAEIPDSVIAIAYEAIPPLFAIWLLLYAIFALPVVYRYRMASYCLLDNPRKGALAAMRKSKLMMRSNRFRLLKLDLSFWWYYLLLLLSLAVCYGDVILPMLGISLPFSPTVSYYLFYVVYVVFLFGVTYCFRNYTDVTYAKVYASLCPPEAPPSGGVVLGNIFQM